MTIADFLDKILLHGGDTEETNLLNFVVLFLMGGDSFLSLIF